MRLPIKAFLIFFWGALSLSFACSGKLAAEEGSVATCQLDLEPRRGEMLNRLNRLEDSFVKMNWQFVKFMEVTYRPLWQAKNLKEDPFSPSRQAAGETLFQRYRMDSDYFLQRSEEYQNEIHLFLSEFEGVPPALTDVCSAWDYQDCSLKWRQEIEDSFRLFQELMDVYFEDLNAMTENIQKSVRDNPSEHHVYRVRYHEQFDRWNLDIYPKFLYLIRTLRERIKYSWIADTCCHLCTEGKKAKAEHPFYTMMQADPEGFRGIHAGVVGRQNLEDAFEDFSDDLEEGYVEEPEEFEEVDYEQDEDEDEEEDEDDEYDDEEDEEDEEEN